MAVMSEQKFPSALEIRGLTITEGLSSGHAGGVLNEGELSLVECMLTRNRAQGRAGTDGALGGPVVQGGAGEITVGCGRCAGCRAAGRGHCDVRTVVGIRGVERELLWSARNMGAGERELLWQIALPAALPQIITGLQVALPIALIVAIVTEMFMGGYGLGGAMNTASRFADSRGVFAGIVEIAVIGYALVKGMMLVRRRLLLWHQEALAPSTV